MDTLLPLAWFSQVFNSYPMDCGPACDAACIALATGRAYSVAMLASDAGIPTDGSRGTSPTNLRDQLARFGVASYVTYTTVLALKANVREGKPTICLVNYRALYPNAADRYDKNFTGNHFVIASGVRESDDTLLVNDPLWQNELDGAYRPIPDQTMDNALRLSYIPRQVVVVTESAVMSWVDTLKTELVTTVPTSTVQVTANGKGFAGQASFLQTALGVTYVPPVTPPITVQYVQAPDGLRVRTSPAGSDTGKRLPYGTKIEAQGMYTVTGSVYYWTKIVKCDTVAGVAGNYCASRSIDGTEVYLLPTNPTQAP